MPGSGCELGVASSGNAAEISKKWIREYRHRTVAATTTGLLELADWLAAAGCTHRVD